MNTMLLTIYIKLYWVKNSNFNDKILTVFKRLIITYKIEIKLIFYKYIKTKKKPL